MMLRPLSPTDLDRALALDMATNLHPWNRQQWHESLTQHVCLGLELEGGLAGFAIAQPLPPDEAELLLIAIQPAAQGQGWGRALFAGLCQTLLNQGCTQLFLEVRESNQRARAFYHAAGLSEVGRRKAYYPTCTGREDALLLSGALA